MTKIVLIFVALVAVVALAGCGSSEDPSGPADYRVEPSESWPQIEDHTTVDGYVENAWRDPAYPYVVFAINTRASDETASPLTSAQLARVQTTKLAGYKERGMRWIRLGGRPAVRWSFNLPNRGHIEYFFEECGISFLVRGTTGLSSFEAISAHMREMAATIKTACSK